MESISELRKICQTTRPSIFKDFLNKFYYRFSIYFTWLCILLKLSANQVTIISVLFSILGGILISIGDKNLTIIGFVCFHIFAILDMSDGEVARYRNQGGMTGHFLDWYMHFITSLAMMLGLFLHSFDALGSGILISLGIISITVPIFDKIITSSGWTVIVWTRLRDIKNNVKPNIVKKDKVLKQKKNSNYFFKLVKFIALHLLQDHWIKLSLLIISIIDLVFYNLGLVFFDYIFYTLIYIGIIGPIYIYIQIYKIMNSDRLLDGYNRLFISKEEPIFPDADFL